MAGKFKIMGYDKGNDTYEQIEEARTKKEALLAAESVMNKYLHTEELQKKYGNIVVKNAQGQIIEIFSAECPEGIKRANEKEMEANPLYKFVMSVDGQFSKSVVMDRCHREYVLGKHKLGQCMKNARNLIVYSFDPSEEKAHATIMNYLEYRLEKARTEVSYIERVLGTVKGGTHE